MIKTTNYEISKKLAEIGFRAQCSYFYFHSDNNDCEASSLEKYGFDKINECDIEDKYYPAYDLETLLDALPKSIIGPDASSPEFLTLTKEYISYESYSTLDCLQVDRKLNESLGDIAGRMLILLHENNLIKF